MINHSLRKGCIHCKFPLCNFHWSSLHEQSFLPTLTDTLKLLLHSVSSSHSEFLIPVPCHRSSLHRLFVFDSKHYSSTNLLLTNTSEKEAKSCLPETPHNLVKNLPKLPITWSKTFHDSLLSVRKHPNSNI